MIGAVDHCAATGEAHSSNKAVAAQVGAAVVAVMARLLGGSWPVAVQPARLSLGKMSLGNLYLEIEICGPIPPGCSNIFQSTTGRCRQSGV